MHIKNNFCTNLTKMIKSICRAFNCKCLNQSEILYGGAKLIHNELTKISMTYIYYLLMSSHFGYNITLKSKIFYACSFQASSLPIKRRLRTFYWWHSDWIILRPASMYRLFLRDVQSLRNNKKLRCMLDETLYSRTCRAYWPLIWISWMAGVCMNIRSISQLCRTRVHLLVIWFTYYWLDKDFYLAIN